MALKEKFEGESWLALFEGCRDLEGKVEAIFLENKGTKNLDEKIVSK